MACVRYRTVVRQSPISTMRATLLEAAELREQLIEWVYDRAKGSPLPSIDIADFINAVGLRPSDGDTLVACGVSLLGSCL